jgi:hypothetical protein
VSDAPGRPKLTIGDQNRIVWGPETRISVNQANHDEEILRDEISGEFGQRSVKQTDS